MYGGLILADSQYGGNNGRRWKVDWNKAPQPVQIKLRCLRGLLIAILRKLLLYAILVG